MTSPDPRYVTAERLAAALFAVHAYRSLDEAREMARDILAAIPPDEGRASSAYRRLAPMVATQAPASDGLDVETLARFARRVGSMGLCSQTHHEFIARDARALAATLKDAAGKDLPWHHGFFTKDGKLLPRYVVMGICAAKDGAVYVTTIYPYTVHEFKGLAP